MDNLTNRNTGKEITPIGTRNVWGILLLGTAGQIAWAVENGWFNTFVYDRITTDPNPIAWMVAVSAIVATVTSLIMGIASDRTVNKHGKRKPYIVLGYIFWGIITAIYPMVEWIQITGIAIVMVIILDAVMTFFGSTANDAAFNAWLADISESSNRNRIDALNRLTSFVAQILALIAAGLIIDNFGYFVFFYILGGLVTLTGVISAFLLESKRSEVEEPKLKTPFWSEFKSLVDIRVFKNNRNLFLLFMNMALSGIASQIYFPYLFIFVENYLGFTKTEIALRLGGLMIFTIIMMIVIGLISHKFNRKTQILIGSVIGSVFMIIMSQIADDFVEQSLDTLPVLVIFFIGYIFMLAAQIAHGGWLLDRYPGGEEGKFQGVRMIFMVALPMVVGPPIGSFIIQTFGIPVEGGFIPTPEIFLFGGIFSLFALIPILMINKNDGIVQIHKSLQ